MRGTLPVISPPIRTPQSNSVSLAHEEFLQALAAGAAELQLGAVAQDDDVLAARVLVQLFDAVEVDDGGAVRAPEGLRVEALLKLLHAQAEQVRLAADVELDVVVVGLDPVHVRRVDEDDAAARLDHEARQVAALLSRRGDRGLFVRAAPEEGAQALGQTLRLAQLDVRLRARERLAEPLVGEGLEQVVERVHLERLERVGVVGGDEDDGRDSFQLYLREHVEAVHAGHLYVEEEEVGRPSADLRDGLRAAAALVDEFDVGVFGGEVPDRAAGHGLVVHDERPNLPRLSAHSVKADPRPSRKGMTTDAVTPLPTPTTLRSSKRWPPP